LRAAAAGQSRVDSVGIRNYQGTDGWVVLELPRNSKSASPLQGRLLTRRPSPVVLSVPVLKNAANVARVEGASLGPVPVLQDGKVDAP
jgi:hypothetical protein